jgi:hypothetical protein
LIGSASCSRSFRRQRNGLPTETGRRQARVMDDHRLKPTPLRPPCSAPRAVRGDCHQCAELERATRLLERCEAFLPPHLQALIADVRDFLDLDARGMRVVPTAPE